MKKTLLIIGALILINYVLYKIGVQDLVIFLLVLGVVVLSLIGTVFTRNKGKSDQSPTEAKKRYFLQLYQLFVQMRSQEKEGGKR